MTANACSRQNSNVVEGRSGPGQGVVAGIAGGDGEYVLCGLANGTLGNERAVVASQASAFGHSLVAEHDDAPVNGLVANVALLGGRNVLERKLGGVGTAGVAVAGGALAGSAAEYALDVAGLAAGRYVLIGEREARGGVVECSVRYGRLGERRAAEKREACNEQPAYEANRVGVHDQAPHDCDQRQML